MDAVAALSLGNGHIIGRQREIETRLSAAEQFQIDRSEQSAIDRRPMLDGPTGRYRNAGIGRRGLPAHPEIALAPSPSVSTNEQLTGSRCRRASSAFKNARSNSALWITSRSEPMKANNSSADLCKRRLVREELCSYPVHREGFFGHVAFRVDVTVEFAVGRDVMDKLDAGDLDDPVPFTGSRPVVSVSRTISRITIYSDCTVHRLPLARPDRHSRKSLTIAFKRRKVALRPTPVGTTKSARRRF